MKKSILLITIVCAMSTFALGATKMSPAGKAAARKRGYSDTDIAFIEAWLQYKKGASLDAVHKALNAGANPDVLMDTEMDMVVTKNNRALIDAIRRDDREAVRLLMSFHANPTEQWHGLTAVEWAAKSENPDADILAFLLAGVADGKEKNKGLFFGNARTKRTFLEHGADVNAVNADGETVLMKAIQDWDIDSIKMLLAHKVDVNKKDVRGKTALDHALFEVELVRDIMQEKNDKTAKNMSATIAQIVKMLEDAGARPGTPRLEDGKKKKRSFSFKKDKRDEE